MRNKVLIIVENLPAPFDRRVWGEACSLRENGYEVTVLCPRAKGYEEGRQVIDGVRIYRHPMVREGNGFFGYLREYACALFWEFVYAWWIYLRHGFDVIQGCNPPDDVFLVALPFKLLGVKYIFDHHDASPELFFAKYGTKGLLYKIQIWLEHITFRFSDAVMSTNASYRELAIARGGVAPKNVFVVRNGPDLTRFKAVSPNAALKHGKTYLIGYVGNIGDQDGLDILLDVALRIKSLGRVDVHFTCVGSGSGLKSLQRMAHEKGLGDMVTFTGRVSDDEMLEILSTADICVNPDRPCEMNSISTMIKVMEYMALAKPIIQFDLKEGRFSAQDASLYADVDDRVADFAAKIAWLLDNPDARRRMGEYGYRRVAQGLAGEHSVPNLLAAYEAALSPEAESRSAVARTAKPERGRAPSRPLVIFTRAYYAVKPLLPLALSLVARRRRADSRRRAYASVWPIDQAAGATPPGWPGWPEGKRFAFVLTHDVEGNRGLGRVERLMDLEMKHGFRSSFNFVPEGDYRVPEAMRRRLGEAGFEVGIHGLNHDGKLYNSKAKFAGKAAGINGYLREWGACGFRSPSMQHRLEWLHQLDVEYDCSTFDTDPFEPEPDGFGTIFPFWVAGPNGSGYVELPYSLPQDFTLFVLLRERTIDVWKRKLDWVAEHGGMALLDSHPDYMAFDGEPARDEYPASYYEELLRYAREKYDGLFWEATPREVARFYCASVPVAARNTRKKICMLAYSNYEADGRVRRYAEALASRGDRVDVIALSNSSGRLDEVKISGVAVYPIQRRELNERSKWAYAYRLLRFLLASSLFLTRRQHHVRYD